jgi:hypothetical protein
MNIDKLREDQIKYYKLKGRYDPVKINLKKINIESVIHNLCFIVNYLISKKYTLSMICINDFELFDNVLFLNSDDHLVEIDSKNTFLFSKDQNNKKQLCFPTIDMVEGRRISINATYMSVGLFVYYLYFYEVKPTLNENDFGRLVGTKPYYFIKNTMDENPCLIYL